MKNYMEARTIREPTTTPAKEIGECCKCGYPIYEGLHHDCPTAPKLKIEDNNQFGIKENS